MKTGTRILKIVQNFLLFFYYRAQEIMSLKSSKHPCVTLALIASMPRVFEAVQDKCIVKANCKKDSKLFYVSYKRLNYFTDILHGIFRSNTTSFACNVHNFMQIWTEELAKH